MFTVYYKNSKQLKKTVNFISLTFFIILFYLCSVSYMFGVMLQMFKHTSLPCLSLSPVYWSSGQWQHAAVGDRFFPHSNWTGRSASLPSEEHPSVPQCGHHRAVQPPDCHLIYSSLLDHTVFRERTHMHTYTQTHTARHKYLQNSWA